MNILLITPAKEKSTDGNRISADRWAEILSLNNHKVQILTEYDNSNVDVLIALHAWRSSSSIFRYREKNPRSPLIVVIGGTDANSFLKTNPDTVIKSLEYASAIVCLHNLIGDLFPSHIRKKVHFIPQSSEALNQERILSDKHFDVAVVAHLRDEKDPFRAALAARLMPKGSTLRVNHFGRAYSSFFNLRARYEKVVNSRYHWFGELSHDRIKKEYCKNRLVIISSIQEGGANVLSESISSGLPLIASEIDGNVGLLGDNYSGYFPVGNERELAKLLEKAENEPSFLDELTQQCINLKALFSRERESSLWESLIKKVTSG